MIYIKHSKAAGTMGETDGFALSPQPMPGEFALEMGIVRVPNRREKFHVVRLVWRGRKSPVDTCKLCDHCWSDPSKMHR